MGAFLSRVDAWPGQEKRNDGDVIIDNAEAGGIGNRLDQPKPSCLTRLAGKIMVAAFVAYAIVVVVL